MAIALVQGLFSGSNKATTNTLALTGTKTITAGNVIYISLAARSVTDAVASATDNLGNSYSVVASGGPTSSQMTALLSGSVTTGGSLTGITITTNTNYTAAAAIAAEFSGVGTTSATGSYSATSNNLNAYPGSTTTNTATQVAGRLWVGAFGWLNPVGTVTIPVPSTSGVAATQPLAAVGTLGGSGGSNSSTALAYFICTAATANMLNAQTSVTVGAGAAGIAVDPSSASTSAPAGAAAATDAAFNITASVTVATGAGAEAATAYGATIVTGSAPLAGAPLSVISQYNSFH